MTVVVLQPGYLPWLGFFDQLRRADVFVVYDDVQYDTHGWRNRNRIKTANGPIWLTVPVRHSGLGQPRILDIEIDRRTPWARKHLASIRQSYAAAPYLRTCMPALEELLQRPWTHLVDLDLALVDLLAGWLGLTRRIERASRLGIEGGQNQRLLNICRHFGATTYVSGDAARDYLDVPLFEQHSIAVEWQSFEHPVYPQLHGAFVPYLSALDLVLNCGDDAGRVLERGKSLL
ncbi:MAG: WbqC family protein [Vicinamibacterales bacterium]